MQDLQQVFGFRKLERTRCTRGNTSVPPDSFSL
uniref:Uncharacterized protein n=1 Tax=Populus trichocarpa TaxID=3694 RepID=A0A3N7G531_POPTR